MDVLKVSVTDSFSGAPINHASFDPVNSWFCGDGTYIVRRPPIGHPITCTAINYQYTSLDVAHDDDITIELSPREYKPFLRLSLSTEDMTISVTPIGVAIKPDTCQYITISWGIDDDFSYPHNRETARYVYKRPGSWDLLTLMTTKRGIEVAARALVSVPSSSRQFAASWTN